MVYVIWLWTMNSQLRILCAEEWVELPGKISCAWSHTTRISTGKIMCLKILECGSHTVQLVISLQVISVQCILWTDKQPFLYIAQDTTWQPLQSLSTHSIYAWLEIAVILLSIVKLHNMNESNSCLISKTDKTGLWYKLKKNTCSSKFQVLALKSLFW